MQPRVASRRLHTPGPLRREAGGGLRPRPPAFRVRGRTPTLRVVAPNPDQPSINSLVAVPANDTPDDKRSESAAPTTAFGGFDGFSVSRHPSQAARQPGLSNLTHR